MPWGAAAFWLIIASFYDIRNKALPLPLAALLLLIAAVWDIILAVNGEAVFYERIFGLLPGLFFISLSLLSAGRVGLGDGIALIGVGQLAGAVYIFCTMCAAALICALYALILITVRKASGRRRIAFIPFLLAGFVLVLLAGGGVQW